MLHCEKCKINIQTQHGCCPLCHGGLTGHVSEEEQTFPVLEHKGASRVTFLGLLTFFCVIAVVSAYVVDRLATPQGQWFFYLLGAMLCAWLIISWGKIKSRNLLKNGIWQTLIVGVAVLIWDLCTGFHGWSLDYVVPIVVAVILIFDVVYSLVRKLPASEYMIYLIMQGVLGLVPFLLDWCHLIHQKLPSMICGELSVIILVALFIFRRRQVVEELVKNFHM